MIFGFNTDLRLGDTVYHVQTEDRGDSNPVIDTTIYARGRVLHRHVTNYRELRDSPEFSQEALRQRLEDQHRTIIDALRSGTLAFDSDAAAAPSGIQVQLLNPASWLSAGTATLKLEVREKSGGKAVGDAELKVTVSGMQGPHTFASQTGSDGRAEMVFPLPRLGPGGTDLVIQAKCAAGDDEIRYSLKPKIRSAES